MIPAVPVSRAQRRRARAHQCGTCRRHWALRVVDHPAGPVVLCRFCGAVRAAGRPLSSATTG